MDPAEFEKIVVDPSGELQAVPNDDDWFSGDCVPGYCDGDYPDWLQSKMDYLLPNELLEKYGKLTSTMLNGNYWHIVSTDLPNLLADLDALGYEPVERTDLSFY